MALRLRSVAPALALVALVAHSAAVSEGFRVRSCSAQEFGI